MIDECGKQNDQREIAAVAGFERDLLIEKTQAGLVRAMTQGKKLGRPSRLTQEEHEVVRSRRSQGTSLGVLAIKWRQPFGHPTRRASAIRGYGCDLTTFAFCPRLPGSNALPVCSAIASSHAREPIGRPSPSALRSAA